MTQVQRKMAWALLVAAATAALYFAFRGYLSPELLIQFSDALHC